MNRLNYIFLFIFLISPQLFAETLRALSLKSTALLVLADDAQLQKKCHVSVAKISKLSQNLKAQVDSKIESLSEPDFKILNRQTNTCQTDCSCTLLALAFESKNKKNEFLSKKASEETLADRKKCILKIKNICSYVK